MPVIEPIARLQDEMTRWRRDIHAHPELGFEEHRTSDAVAEKLRGFGLEVHRGIGKTGVVYGEVFGFLRFVDDLIAFRRASLSYLRAFNVGVSRTLGAETQVGVSPWPFLLLEANATFLDARDVTEESNAQLPFRSRLVLAPRLEVRSGRVHALRLERARLEVRYVYQSNRTADPAGLVRIPEQGSLDVEAELTHLGGAWAVRAFAQNLLDQPRYDLIGYPLPGRALFVSAEWRVK